MDRRAAALLGLAAVLALAIGSGGYSSVSADRQVTVEVVGDEDAYMSLEYRETGEVEEGSVLTVTNRFAETVDLTVWYRVEDQQTDPSESGTMESFDGIGPGDSVILTCADIGDSEGIASFDVAAEGSSVSAQTTDSRTVEIECEETEEPEDEETEETEEPEDEETEETEEPEDEETEEPEDEETEETEEPEESEDEETEEPEESEDD
ncbi:hypothetical protein [Haloarcula litorea]|uniref:hypothetical protein n=1 Tax=Haloarcula litorea TaxID=3032579 RepID=UPI0023E7C06C|nr:hypothetical protein [Halomicroarcula sp. GDY20]